MQSYLDWMRHARRLADTTVRDRRSRLSRLTRWLAPTDLLVATVEDLRRWQVEGIGHLSVRAAYVAISHVDAFYTWALEEGLVESNPAARLTRPKLPKRLPRPMSEDDVATALVQAEQPYRCMIALAAYGGLRCMEIANLRREDVLDTNTPPMLLVRGKGAVERLLPLGPALLAELRTYGLPSRGPVFRRLDGKPGPITPPRVSQMLSRHLHELGIDATAHMARHRMATVAYRATRDLRAVQTALGHASPVTTAGYAAIADSALEDAMGAVDATLKRFAVASSPSA